MAGNLRQPEKVMAACCMVFRLHRNNNRQPENSLLGCINKNNRAAVAKARQLFAAIWLSVVFRLPIYPNNRQPENIIAPC
nr:hypothetical protein [uncultured Kingella sp.]